MRSYELSDGKANLTNCKARRAAVDRQSSINRNFTGPAREVVLSSSKTRLQNIGFLGQYEYLRQEVEIAEKRFVDNFYKALYHMNNKIEVSWVDACKARHQELFKVFTAITLQPEEVDVCLVTSNGKVYDLDQITYAPNHFSVKGVSEEEEEIIDVYISKNYPKMYAPLFVAMFKVAYACKATRESEPDLMVELKHLAFSLFERGGLYNETNPDEKEWRRQEDSTIAMLTSVPTREEDPVVEAAYHEVISDIKEGISILRKMGNKSSIKAYVREVCSALVATYKYCQSPFNDDDLYISMSADAAQIDELKKLGIKASLIKSALEGDPLRDGCAFDECTGYVSHYNKDGVLPETWVVTIHIPNPGKFKTRAIHIAVSAIQDRCCYIHNRLYAVLNAIPSDCTKHQERGIEFTRMVTNPTWREDRFWPSVLAFDWSNATDKLWSWFQEDVLRLVFQEPIIEFWHQVSTCAKVLKHKDGTKTPYIQVNGQPQGLLGSFDAFAFAHHIMMLMTMNLSGRTNFLGSEFYRVLGDDSIICSVTNDKENAVGDAYVRICRWCNVPVNRVKSTEIRHDQPVALVEFAKVYALDGEYFSPIPGRLANRIGMPDKEFYALAGAFWGQRHGMDNRLMIKRMIDRYYPEEEDNRLANMLMFGGMVPAFSSMGFSDPEISLSDEALKLTLCYWYNKIKATFALNGLSDSVKEKLSLTDKELKDSLLELIPEKLDFLIDRIQDFEHKLLKVAQSNLDKEDVIKQFLECSDHQALVIAASVRLTQDEVEGIRQILSIIEAISEAPERLDDFRMNILNMDKLFKPLERLNYRSIYKRDTLEVKVFRPTVEMYKQLFSTQGRLAIGPTER